MKNHVNSHKLSIIDVFSHYNYIKNSKKFLLLIY